MSDSGLTPAERAEIERVESVLADRSVWMEPPAHLQEAVVAAIASEAGAVQRRSRVRLALAGAAAVILLAVGVTVGVQLTRADPVEFAATLQGTELAPSATGEVTLTKTAS